MVPRHTEPLYLLNEELSHGERIMMAECSNTSCRRSWLQLPCVTLRFSVRVKSSVGVAAQSAMRHSTHSSFHLQGIFFTVHLTYP